MKKIHPQNQLLFCFPFPQAHSHPRGLGGLVPGSKCALSSALPWPQSSPMLSRTLQRDSSSEGPQVPNPNPPPRAKSPQSQPPAAPDGGGEESVPDFGRRECRCGHSCMPGPALAVLNWLALLHLLPRIYGPFSFKAFNHHLETCAIQAEKGHREGTVRALQKTTSCLHVSHVTSRKESKLLAYIEIRPFLTVGEVNFDHVIPGS